MKNLKVTLLLLGLISAITITSCKDDDTFEDETLFDEWTLEHYEDNLGNIIRSKPDNIPDDIQLIFRRDCILSGHLTSFDIDGNYSLDESGNLNFTLEYPDVPTCCEWDDYFLDRYTTIFQYEIIEDQLHLIFGENEERMVLTNEKVAPFFNPILINEWTLEYYEDSSGEVIHYKPNILPDDIVLIFRKTSIVSGHIASFDVDGTYNIEKTGEFNMSLTYPDVTTCCLWDDLFLETYPMITSYDIVDDKLNLYYEDGKAMVFSTQGVAPYFDPSLINEWTLWRHEDNQGNIIYDRPNDLPRDIILNINQDFTIYGQIVSYDIIDGQYTIDDSGFISIQLALTFLPICCDWDDYFLDNYESINAYEVDGSFLKLYYDNGNKVMILVN